MESLRKLQLEFQRNLRKSPSQVRVRQLGIRPKPPLSARQRFEIYHFAYWARFVESLEEDFPRVRRRLGSRLFRRCAREYIESCRPSEACLAEVSRGFAAFLHKRFPRRPKIGDEARLEWLGILCAQAQEPPRSKGSHAYGGGLRLQVAPSVVLFESSDGKRRWVLFRKQKRVRRLLLGKRSFVLLRACLTLGTLEGLGEFVRNERIPLTLALRWIRKWAEHGLVSMAP